MDKNPLSEPALPADITIKEEIEDQESDESSDGESEAEVNSDSGSEVAEEDFSSSSSRSEDSDRDSENECETTISKIDKKDDTKQDSNSHSKEVAGTSATDAEGATTFICRFCSKEYMKKEELESHLSCSHQPPNPYTCAFCSMICTNSITLSLHTKMAHKSRTLSLPPPPAESVLKCDVCGNVYSIADDLKYHQYKRHNKCLTCSESFPTITTLREHIKKIHKAGQPAQPEKDPKTRRRECNYCHKRCSDYYNLTVHERKHTGEKPFECHICQKKLSSRSNHKRHVERHTNGERPHQCDVCFKSFAQAQKLRHHQILHDDKEAWKCDTCGKSYSDASTLRKHKLIHTRVMISCDACDKEFVSQEALDLHKERRHGPNVITRITKKVTMRFECRCCGKRFRQAQNWKAHERTHDKEGGTHECEYCGEEFTNMSLLKQHEKIHTYTENEFECEQCGKSYSRSISLENHIKRMHPKDEEEVELVEDAPPVKQMKIEPGTKVRYLFPCDECDSSYCHLRSLRKHQRKKHGVKPDDGEDSP